MDIVFGKPNEPRTPAYWVFIGNGGYPATFKSDMGQVDEFSRRIVQALTSPQYSGEPVPIRIVNIGVDGSKLADIERNLTRIGRQVRETRDYPSIDDYIAANNISGADQATLKRVGLMAWVVPYQHLL